MNERVPARQGQIYDIPAADRLYRAIWGHNIHFGVFRAPDWPLERAMLEAKREMAAALAPGAGDEVIEVACGFGTSAQFLARERGCRVAATNISETQLAQARALLAEAQLDDRVQLSRADFHDLPFEDGRFQGWWCQEAITHSNDKPRVFREAHRVLAPGGRLILSDQMIRRDLLSGEEAAIIADRHRSGDLWGVDEYHEALRAVGFTIERHEDWSAHLAPFFAALVRRVDERREALEEAIDAETIRHNRSIWSLWQRASGEGKIGWGFTLARKAESA